MPSVSKKQHNLMAMVANDPAAAKRVGVPQSVGEEYMLADKGKKFSAGKTRARPDLQKVNKPSTRHGKSEFFSGGGMAESKKMVGKEIAFMKKKGAPKSMVKHEMAEAGMKKGGMAKYAKGGFVAPSKMGAVKTAAPSKDGVAVKGKTKGTMIKMKRGGSC
jgi:hypothetical protein